MIRKNKTQFALEFVMLIAFMLLIFLGFFALTSSRVLEAKDSENRQIAQELADTVYDEIKMANSVSEGYTRTFSVPRKVKGISYTITILEDRELVVNYSGNEYVVFLPDNVQGTVGKGVNEIKKIGGIIYLSSIAECSDGSDNDGDGYIDLADDGCDELSGNDESNCGDGACEGYETCISCVSDCSTCFVPGKLIFKDSEGDNIASFDHLGNLVLAKNLVPSSPVNPSGDRNEFIFKNSLGDPVAMIIPNGQMHIAGEHFEDQEDLNPTGGNNLIIKDFEGNVISYIDESGDLYLKGTLTESGDP